MIDLPAAPSYPWLLGTTSFVLPAGMEENVRALAGQVDAVQLLFFESKANARLAHRVDVGLLAGLAAEHNLSYAVHLPLDIHLGSKDRKKRQQGLDEICRLLEELGPLNPKAFDLHLHLEQDLERGAWQDNLRDSLDNLGARSGEWQQKIGIENIGYDFDLVEDVADACNFGICVDFGHRLRYNQQTDFWALPHWRHIHLHGASAGQDHHPFHAEDQGFLRALGQKLMEKDYRGIVTLELYELNRVRDSLAVLHEAWQPFQQGESV
ncbi:MAG: sugar phosphate isomerase/epimerase [Proteobacteria bacterium]|nr:sugar phosphate isomerase/epimerase [Pseudomonadota bacterium]MBU1639071.1 sugar phosphate isomerase/epimerase [Pseudomonadota bacterium]